MRIGYIDTDYILENIPDYQEINQQLNTNVQVWKKEIEKWESTVKNKREVLNKERILLTEELIQEREEDLEIEEEEIYQYKQDRFGPEGDFILQKKQLIQPIQDQIFLAIREIAKTKKYDFIFDKSADVVMLYSDRRYDISEQVLRTILRTNNRNQVVSRREKKKLEQESIISKPNTEDNVIVELENKNEGEKKNELEELRKKILEEQELKSNEINDPLNNNDKEERILNKSLESEKKNLTMEERKKILEEKRKKIRDARKAKLEGKDVSKDSTFTKN